MKTSKTPQRNTPNVFATHKCSQLKHSLPQEENNYISPNADLIVNKKFSSKIEQNMKLTANLLSDAMKSIEYFPSEFAPLTTTGRSRP